MNPVQIEKLRDKLPWRLWGSDVPVLGNPLGGLCSFPEEIIRRTVSRVLLLSMCLAVALVSLVQAAGPTNHLWPICDVCDVCAAL